MEKIMNRFYCHNGAARISMGLNFNPETGHVSLALAIARKGDEFRKVEARKLLDKRLEDFESATERVGPLPVGVARMVVSLGNYDGRKTRNDIFAPLLDFFRELADGRKNVDYLLTNLNMIGSSLIIIANHRIAREHRNNTQGLPIPRTDLAAAKMEDRDEDDLCVGGTKSFSPNSYSWGE
jgi:hypothetical protein